MALLAYLGAVVITVAGLLIGLDWLVTPLDSVRSTPHGVSTHTATTQPASAQPASSRAASSHATGPRAPAAPAVASRQADAARAASRDDATAAKPVAQVAQQTAAAKCDVQACASAYQSFRPSDCTYQPYNGPRRVCEKGAHAATANGAVTRLSTLADASNTRAEAHCNVAACSSAYQSFRASDCSYQPFDGGPRRLCER